MDDETTKYAGFWRRVIAVFIDSYVVGFMALNVCVLVIILFLLYVSSVDHRALVLLPDILLGLSELGYGYILQTLTFFVWVAYFAGHHSSSKRATYGKMMLGIKVTDIDGFRISWMHGVWRYFAMYLSILTLFIGFLMAGFTKHKQALHDKVSKTLVIREGDCHFLPAIKSILISLLFLALMVSSSGYYAYRNLNHVFTTKNIEEFMQSLVTTMAAEMESHLDYKQTESTP